MVYGVYRVYAVYAVHGLGLKQLEVWGSAVIGSNGNKLKTLHTKFIEVAGKENPKATIRYSLTAIVVGTCGLDYLQFYG